MHSFEPSQGLRLRPVPEMDICLAYLPRPPRLLRLNLEAWALMEAVGTCAGLARPQAAVLRLLDDCGWEQTAEELTRRLEALAEEGLLVRRPVEAGPGNAAATTS